MDPVLFGAWKFLHPLKSHSIIFFIATYSPSSREDPMHAFLFWFASCAYFWGTTLFKSIFGSMLIMKIQTHFPPSSQFFIFLIFYLFSIPSWFCLTVSYLTNNLLSITLLSMRVFSRRGMIKTSIKYYYYSRTTISCNSKGWGNPLRAISFPYIPIAVRNKYSLSLCL